MGMGKYKWVIHTIGALLIAIGGYAAFSLARIGFEDALVKVGVVSETQQLLLILACVIILLAIIGISFRAQIKKMVG
jgi:hypothetical protein